LQKQRLEKQIKAHIAMRLSLSGEWYWPAYQASCDGRRA